MPPAGRSVAVVLGPLDRDRRASTPSGLIDEGDLTAEPLIDEPVTSGGDANVWTGSPQGQDEKGKPK